MSVYSTGSVNIKVGSTSITGNNTSFTTYASAGDLFKLANRNNIYDISAVNTATNLTLTARFRDTIYETARTAEHVATTDATELTYGVTLDNLPVIQETLVVTGSDETWTDTDGSGSLSCSASPTGSSGTFDCDTGVLSITYSATPTNDYVITAAYTSGDSINTMEYQVVKDFTTHYSLPEMSLNDTNFQTIYTKAVRLIDAAVWDVTGNQSVQTKTADYALTTGDFGDSLRMNSTNPHIFTLPTVDTTNDGGLVIIEKINSGKVTVNVTGSVSIDDSNVGGSIHNGYSNETQAAILLEYAHGITTWIRKASSGTWTTTSTYEGDTTITATATFSSADGKVFFIIPSGADRDFNASGTFNARTEIKVVNRSATHNVIFDSEGSSQSISPSQYGNFFFNGTTWY